MRQRALGMAVCCGLLLLAACDDTETCGARCPEIADSYAVLFNSVTRQCGFTPWLLPPTLVIGQDSGADRVTLGLIDPVNQQPVLLLGDLRVPGDPESDAVAVFHGFQRTVRQADWSQRELIELQLFFSGAITVEDGRRRLSLTLQTQPVLGGSCTATQIVYGTGARVP